MKISNNRGFTLFEVCIVIIIIALLVSIISPFILLRRSKNAAIKDHFQTSLIYGLANGTQPIALFDNWYYFQEPKDSNIVTVVSTFLSRSNNPDQLIPTFILQVYKNVDVSKYDARLNDIVVRSGLTNGYLVVFSKIVKSGSPELEQEQDRHHDPFIPNHPLIPK